MIISRTPFRISFFGGGTDYPEWYREHGGRVLAATIDKYSYLTCRYLPPFFEHKFRIVWSKIENVKNIDEIQHPVVREVLRYLKIDHGVEIHHDGDLPARSGIGSSSSFVVGLLHALYALKGKTFSKHKLAIESIHIEQDILREKVGSQDQISAAYGGLNRILFHRSGEISVKPMTLSQERIHELNSHLMLFFTGFSRRASEIAKSYDFRKRKEELSFMNDMVDEGVSILNSGRDLTDFGLLLNEAWKIKCSLSSKISNPYINEIYSSALSAGAIGGKVTGAGGGGFMLFFVPLQKQKRVRGELKKLIHVPFKFDFSGSQIIFYTQQENYSYIVGD